MLFVNLKFVVTRRLAVASISALVGVVGVLAFAAAAASAAPGDHFTCRGSALRVSVPTVLNTEPEVANPANDPCASDSATTATVSIPGLLSTGVASATTISETNSGSATGQVASVNAPVLGVSADAAIASASYACVGTTTTPQTSSDVVNLRIGGMPITSSEQVNLPLLGLVDIELNRTTATATSVTRRAVDITVLGGLYGGAHIILGEASAGVSGDPCASSTSGLGQPVITSEPPASTVSRTGNFTYYSTTPGAALECSLDNGTFVPCNGTSTYTGLSLGTHTFSVHEVMNSVVGPSASYTWNVIKAVRPVNTGRPTISGTPKAGRTLTCSNGSWTNGPIRFAYQWRRDGVLIIGATKHTYRVQTDDEGLDLTCTVLAFNAAGGSSATSRRVTVSVPFVFGCPRATGRLSGKTLGLLRLGMTRPQARGAYTRSSTRGRHDMDFFCLTPRGVRAGYASTALLNTLSFGERQRVKGRVVLALTAYAFYALRGLRPGVTLIAARNVLGPGRLWHIGLNYWYLAPHGAWTAVLKVRHGIVEEIGIADVRLTTGRKAQFTFIRSFK